jgi:hypothetical protein
MFGSEFAGVYQDLRETTLTTPLWKQGLTRCRQNPLSGVFVLQQTQRRDAICLSSGVAALIPMPFPPMLSA